MLELAHALPTVSRETLLKIETFSSLLLKWNKTHNLIRTHGDLLTRHILDSWQLTTHIDKKFTVLDVGSGNGFPGMILALAGYTVTLSDRDSKKISFLKYAAAELDLTADFFHGDIFEYTKQHDVVVARGFSELKTLIKIQKNVSRETQKAIGYYLKGIEWEKEIEIAQKEYAFLYSCAESITQKDALILKIENVC